jgi:hypothetical protein
MIGVGDGKLVTDGVFCCVEALFPLFCQAQMEEMRGYRQGEHGLDRSGGRADVFGEKRRVDPPSAARGVCAPACADFQAGD